MQDQRATCVPLCVCAVVFGLLLSPATARCERVGEDILIGRLESLAEVLEARRGSRLCEREPCYVLDRLRLTGDVREGALDFELEGSLLGRGPVHVRLFGPPSAVRLGAVTVGRDPATVGFDDQAYFVVINAERFVARGRVSLPADLALTVSGPLNTFEAELEGGRVVEGGRLSGLSETTLHIEAGRSEGDEESATPTVFQLSRAVRVGAALTFEYRLEAQAAANLGVLQLPLRHRERVLEVTGVEGWRIDGDALLLPTSGRTAEIVVTGTLPSLGRFRPDERSAFEWWLFESDAEHRLSLEGQARQFDLSESPIRPSMAHARLFMVGRGRHVEVSDERLVSGQVMGAVVRRHRREVALSAQGDVIAEDLVEYENNGLEYLAFDPRGQAFFLATDGKAQQILHARRGQRALQLPLLDGVHEAKVQTISRQQLGWLGGVFEIPMPEYPLSAGRVELALGLPPSVMPVALIGGDEAWWLESDAVSRSGVAILLALIAACALLRGRRRRALGWVTLSGVWFLAPWVYAVTMLAVVIGGVLWGMGRLAGRKALVGGAVVALGLAGVAVLVGMLWLLAPPEPHSLSLDMAGESNRFVSYLVEPPDEQEVRFRRLVELAQGGLLEGVTPVALPMPQWARRLFASRQLVTGESPFRPMLFYVHQRALIPPFLLWLGCLVVLLLSLRVELSPLRARLERWLEELRALKRRAADRGGVVRAELGEDEEPPSSSP